MLKRACYSLWTLLLMGLTACAYTPSFDVPQVQLPTFYGLSEAADQPPVQRWWRRYGSDELNTLFDELNSNSFDLEIARQRIEKVGALLNQQRADNWPTLVAQLGHRINHDIDNKKTVKSHYLNFNAAYEVDIWGRRSAANYSTKVRLIRQQQEYQSLVLQLQASLAQNYFSYLALQARYTIAQQNLKASKALLNLIQLRFDAGSVSGIELNQQRNTWLSAQVDDLSIKRSLDGRGRSLAVLLGREDLQSIGLTANFQAINLPAVSLVQPAALLEYRPDIKLAEAQLRLNEAVLYQEKKKRWPALKLSAGLGVNDVFSGADQWAGSLIGALAGPLFNAGKITQQIEASKADLRLAQVSYRQVVVQAMQEALDTLNELAFQRQVFAVRENELSNNQQLYELAKLRYDSGDTDFLNLLTAQRSWFNARDTVIQAKHTQLTATVNVFKAMGVAPQMVAVSVVK